MGLSSKKTTETKQTVTTPTNPDWVQGPVQDYWGSVSNLSKTDPYSYVAPASGLQSRAFDLAGGLSADPGGGYAEAMGLARSADGANANLASAPGPATMRWASNAPSAPSAQASAAWAPTSTATWQGYDPNLSGSATVGTVSKVQAQSLLDNLDAYMNPYTDAVVNTTLADYDANAGQRRANDDLQAARNSALGGSGFALQKSLTEGELARGRATTEAGLRANAFNTGAQLSSQDADRRQQASAFNAGAENQRGLSQAGFDQQSILANQEAQNQAAQFYAQAGDQASQFNAGQLNAANQFNAGQANTLSQFNAGQANDMSRFDLDQANTTSRFNAGQANDMGRFDVDQANSMSRFNATQADSAAARQLQAAGVLGQLTQSSGADSRSILALIDQLGGEQRGIDQAQRTAPISLLQAIGSLEGQGQAGLFAGSNQTMNSTTIEDNPIGQLSSLLGAAGGFSGLTHFTPLRDLFK